MRQKPSKGIHIPPPGYGRNEDAGRDKSRKGSRLTGCSDAAHDKSGRE